MLAPAVAEDRDIPMEENMANSRRIAVGIASALAMAIGLAGCSGAGAAPSPKPSASDDPRSDAGATLTVESGLTATKGANFEAALAEFENETGIKVTHVGVPNVQTDLTTRIQAGSPPDVALFPQPGLVQDLASQGKVQPLDNVLDMAKLKSGLAPGLLQIGQAKGKTYAVPYDISVKSLIWYSPKAFKAAGYSVPTTWAQFIDLTKKMAASGTAPFCFGIESGTGTGWPATDWLEDLVLRTAGPNVYDQWVSHKTKFDSPQIQKALKEFSSLLLAKGQTYGGANTIVSTKWSNSIAPMFTSTPGCYLYHQGSFMATSMPAGVTVGTDVSAFYLPGGYPGGYTGKPVEGAGDMAVMLKKSSAAEKLMNFLASPQGGEAWAKKGGFLSPWTSFDKKLYPDDLTRLEADMISKATAFRFDASDAMPGAVGTGAFYQQLTAFINGDQPASDTLKNIDAAWPAQ